MELSLIPEPSILQGLVAPEDLGLNKFSRKSFCTMTTIDLPFTNTKNCAHNLNEDKTKLKRAHGGNVSLSSSSCNYVSLHFNFVLILVEG